MCESAGISFLTEGKDQKGEKTKYHLLRLLDSVWEGTEEDALNLTTALLAIKKLRSSSNTKIK